METNPSLEVTRRILVLPTKSNTSLKVVAGESLRRLRALEVPEKIGTAEAQKVLERSAESSKVLSGEGGGGVTCWNSTAPMSIHLPETRAVTIAGTGPPPDPAEIRTPFAGTAASTMVSS